MKPNRMKTSHYLRRLFYRLSGMKQAHRRTPDPFERSIQEPVLFRLSPDAYLVVYWKERDVGRCPGISLYVYDEEILRFDCFGYPHGHYHFNLNDPVRSKSRMEDRIYCFEKTVEEQVERACFELRTNLRAYLHRNPNPRVREFHPDQERLEGLVSEVRGQMLDYIRKSEGRLF